MSAIRFDFTNVLADAVGADDGLSEEELVGCAEASLSARERVLDRRTSDLRWLDLPYQDDVVADISAYADSVRGRFRNVVVLGIGGSALGNTALHTALNSPYYNLDPPAGLPRLFVLDNVDPDLVGEFLDHVEPDDVSVQRHLEVGLEPPRR